MAYLGAQWNQDGAGVPKDVSSLIQAAQLAFHTEGPLMSRQDLLSTVGAIKNLLSEAYRHLNARTVLSELPQELLALIFNEVVVVHEPDTPVSFPAIASHGNRPISRALKVMSQVCRLWRDVAFGTPALWTHIDSRSYPRDELYNVLQRSSALPISLFLHNASLKLEDSTETGTMQVNSGSLLQTIASRLRRVDLDVEKPKPPTIEELLSFNGSTVQCLTISSTFSEVMYGAPNSATHVIPILQGEVDSLEALAIFPSIGWVPANHFPSLTHLYVSFLSGYAQSPDPQDILFLLHNTPRLQFLHLHHLASRDSPSTNEPWRSESSPIELQELRSLVFAYCAYKPAVDVLRELSLPQSTVVRLDDTYIPYDHYPDTLPSGIGPLKRIDAMEIAVTDNSFFLVAEGNSSGFWLKMRTFQDIDLDPWVSHLHIPMPFETLVTLRLDARDAHVFTLLQHVVQLSELSVVLSPGWEDGPGFARTLPPLIQTLCYMLSRRQPVICPSLSSLTIQWPKGMSSFEDLGVPDVVNMLWIRATLRHPVARLVVQANSTHIYSEQPSFFATQLAQLAEHVEEYEECADWSVDVCASELRAMWNVEGAEDYWSLDEMQRARSMPLGRPPPRVFRSWR